MLQLIWNEKQKHVISKKLRRQAERWVRTYEKVKWVLLLFLTGTGYSHELYSVVGITLQEVKKLAARKGTRLYLVRYKNDIQQGRKKRIPVT